MANGAAAIVTVKSSYLTKTRYVGGLSCSKWLWLAFNAPDRPSKIDDSVRNRLEEGRQIGELARLRYPAGMLLPAESPEDNDRRSRKLLDERVPLFEAGFTHPAGNCYARADVLLPVGENGWDIVEVKSGVGLKEEYLHDVAFQLYCYSRVGLNIRKCSLLLVNTKYERSGEIDPLLFFRDEDVTAVAKGLLPTVEPNVTRLLEIAQSKDCPEFGRGERFHEDESGVHSDDSVWTKHPDSDIRDLYSGGKRILGLLETGVFRIRDIPNNVILTGRQRIQCAAHNGGQVHVDRKRIATFLRGLKYPLHFLDFETVYPAIPLFDGTKPYQQIPFQFSVHVVSAPRQKPLHHSFLSLEQKDPREELLNSLCKVIGPEGNLVAYRASFEKSRLEELAKFLPQHAKWIRDAKSRFVDLLIPFQALDYYSPAQCGSASLKAVLPAIAGKGYDDLAIANGSQASLAFLRAAFGTGSRQKASRKEVNETRRALERYCGQDTEGMVWIVEKLTDLAEGSDS